MKQRAITLLAIAATALGLLAAGAAPKAEAAECSSPPTISGTETGGFARFGHQLSGQNNCTTFLNGGTKSLEWFSCSDPADAASCASVGTASTYTPGQSDIGRFIRLVETADDISITPHASNSAATGRVKGRPPTAAFSATTPVYPGDTISLDGSGSSDPDGQSLSYQWDLDGGGGLETSTGSTSSATTSFPTPGLYTLRLQVTDSDGDKSAIVSHTVRVKGPPKASFVFSPSNPIVGTAVTFTSKSTDPDGDPLAYAWDLDGDGAYDDGAAQVVKHVYTQAKAYTVRLRVTADGQTSTAFRSVDVDAKPAPAPVTPTPPKKRKKKKRLRLLRPFPKVGIGGFITGRGVRLTMLSVSAPRGSKVMIKCRGRGCPRRTTRAKVGRRKRKAFRSFRRRFRPGAKIRVYVWKKNRIGKLTTFRIRRTRAPARSDRCLNPNTLRATRCPR